MVGGGPALIYSPEAAKITHQLRLELSTLIRVYLFGETKVTEYMLV